MAEYDAALGRVFKLNLVNGLYLTADQMRALLKVVRRHS